MPRMFNFSLRHSGDKSFSEAIIDQMCQDLASESDDIISQAKNALTIRDPNNELLKMELITKLAPNVSSIRALYDLAIDIETIFAALIQISSQKSTKKAAGFLMEKIASLVEFAVSFDGIKSKTPDIQNDLSHFRRFIAVNTAVSNQLESSVTDAPLNAMSFFVADHCPMLKALIRAIECAMTKEPAAVEVSAVLANSRCCSVSGSRPKDGRPMMNYLRAMTGAIILYDHTAMHGAFGSKSEVKIKRCVKELVQWKQNAHGATSELMDTIKYCSLHYNDSTTPEKIRTLMDK
ncbi:CYFIP-related Rac1 interactor A [Phytophthora ramorum]|uniref:CYFIP-related Rac1 interactor A n=1 Tax=Phytophthora ramorum TaxID=164328 RepID=UPI0030A40D9C|nr:CYFIP-related Rac1 interactor A [Phytophthora ramorum]